MLKSVVVGLSLSITAGVAIHGQTVRTPVAAETGLAEMQKFQIAMMAAQTAAMKAGDEALPCEALQKELVSTMNSPAIQAHAAKTNAAYAKELASQQKNAVMTPAAAAALAAALAPGMAMTGMPPTAGLVPGQAMTPQQMQQVIAAQQQATVAYMNQMAPIMPALMRSQRVGMLAVMKNCGWATGGVGLIPGLTPAAR